MKRQAGFTLIELMITVVIIAILTAIAVPNYSRYMLRSRLTDAHTALAGAQPLAEQYWSNNRTYVGMNGAGIGVLPSNTNYFDFTLSSGTVTAYTIQARGKGPTAGFTFTINQRGNRATTAVPTGWTTSTTCWVKEKNGSCSE